MKFVPDEPEKRKVIYFEDATRDAGYAGYTSKRNEETLVGEITTALNRLGCRLTQWYTGKFVDEFKNQRRGFVFEFSQPSPHGNLPGIIRVAALPLRNYSDTKDAQARRMALFQLRDYLVAAFQFSTMSVGFAPIVPFMLNKNGETVSEVWLDMYDPSRTLPAPKDIEPEVVEGEISET